jgi:hypothetical protein
VSALQATVYSELSKRHAAATAAGYAEANLAGVETLAGIVKQKAIECDLRRRRAVTYALAESSGPTSPRSSRRPGRPGCRSSMT